MGKLGFLSVLTGLFVFLLGIVATAFLSAAYLSVVAIFMYAILTLVGIVPPQPLL